MGGCFVSVYSQSLQIASYKGFHPTIDHSRHIQKKSTINMFESESSIGKTGRALELQILSKTKSINARELQQPSLALQCVSIGKLGRKMAPSRHIRPKASIQMIQWEVAT